MDLTDAIYRYVRTRKAAGELASSTATDTRYILLRFANAVTATTLAGVRRSHLEAWLETRDVAPRTLARELACVRTFFRWSVERGWINRDPTRGIKGPRRYDGDPPRNLALTSVRATLEHAPDARTRVIVLLMVQEGLRRAEVAGARIENLHRTDRLLRVRGKGGKERYVPVSDDTMGAITAYLGEYPATSGPLVRSYLNPREGLDPQTIGKMIARVMYEAGVKEHAYDGRSAHAYRHTCAVDMADRGADPRAIQEFLGHANLATTSRYTKRRAAATWLREAAEGRSYF